MCGVKLKMKFIKWLADVVQMKVFHIRKQGSWKVIEFKFQVKSQNICTWLLQGVYLCIYIGWQTWIWFTYSFEKFPTQCLVDLSDFTNFTSNQILVFRNPSAFNGSYICKINLSPLTLMPKFWTELTHIVLLKLCSFMVFFSLDIHNGFPGMCCIHENRQYADCVALCNIYQLKMFN